MAYMPELYMNTTQREAGVAPHFGESIDKADLV